MTISLKTALFLLGAAFVVGMSSAQKNNISEPTNSKVDGVSVQSAECNPGDRVTILCNGCKTALETYYNHDCSKAKRTVMEASCTTDCAVEAPPPIVNPAPVVNPQPIYVAPQPTSTPPTPVYVEPVTPSSSCCKVCTTGKACGDSCISRNKTCHKGPGCACNG